MGFTNSKKNGVLGVKVKCYNCGYEPTPGIYLYECPICHEEGGLGVHGDSVKCFRNDCKETFEVDAGCCPNCGILLHLVNLP
jgi:hypothetical protein